MLLLALLFVTTKAKDHLQSVEEQPWLKLRDDKRADENEQQRGMRYYKDAEGDWHLVTSAAIPCLVVASILMSYFIYAWARGQIKERRIIAMHVN